MTLVDILIISLICSIIPALLILILYSLFNKRKEKKKAAARKEEKKRAAARKEEKEKELKELYTEEANKFENYTLDWQKEAIILGYRIADFLPNKDIEEVFFAGLSLYLSYPKKAIFSTLAISDLGVMNYYRFQGKGIYQNFTCPVCIDSIPWHEIIDIRMVADAPTSKVTPHYNNVTASHGGVICSNMILPLTSNEIITTYSTETQYHTSGKILIYTNQEYYIFLEKDVATAYQTLMVYWEAYKKAPLDCDHQLPYCSGSVYRDKFKAAYRAFAQEQEAEVKLKDFKF